jgi:hypothetical protein
VNEFVDACRREWKRLRVPETVADEMAAELAADLEEAEAEGVSADEALGTSASDPRSFAAEWAAERGVVGRLSPRRRRFPLVPVAIAVLALIAVAGAVLVIRDSSPASERLAFVVPPPARVAKSVMVNVQAAEAPAPGQVWVTAGGMRIRDARRDALTVGSVLLVTALAGIVLLTLAWWRLGESRAR